MAHRETDRVIIDLLTSEVIARAAFVKEQGAVVVIVMEDDIDTVEKEFDAAYALVHEKHPKYRTVGKFPFLIEISMLRDIDDRGRSGNGEETLKSTKSPHAPSEVDPIWKESRGPPMRYQHRCKGSTLISLGPGSTRDTHRNRIGTIGRNLVEMRDGIGGMIGKNNCNGKTVRPAQREKIRDMETTRREETRDMENRAKENLSQTIDIIE